MRASTRRREVVELKVALNGSIVELVVADDGVGFDSERLASTNDGQFHFGLRAAEERVRRAGGTLTVESTVGQWDHHHHASAGRDDRTNRALAAGGILIGTSRFARLRCRRMESSA